MQAVSAATPKQFRSATKMCGGGLGQGGTACAAHSPRHASPDFLVHQSDLPNHFQFCFNSIWKKLEISNANHPAIQPMKLIQPIGRMIYCAGPISTLCNHVNQISSTRDIRPGSHWRRKRAVGVFLIFPTKHFLPLCPFTAAVRSPAVLHTTPQYSTPTCDSPVSSASHPLFLLSLVFSDNAISQLTHACPHPFPCVFATHASDLPLRFFPSNQLYKSQLMYLRTWQICIGCGWGMCIKHKTHSEKCRAVLRTKLLQNRPRQRRTRHLC